MTTMLSRITIPEKTCVHGFFENCRIALSETTNNQVENKKTFNKNKIYIHMKE